MATAPLDIERQAGADMAVTVAQNPGIILLDTEKFDVWYDRLKAKAPTDADVATRKGREQLRSYAADVRSEKAAIDKARLRLTKEWREMTAQANAAGKVIEERLEGLAVEVRAPLTAWEEAEKARVAECEAEIVAIECAAIIAPEDTAATVRDRGSMIYSINLDRDRFGELHERAKKAKDQAIATLKTGLARLTQEEADRVELARLRAEAAAREAQEREAQAAREQVEREAQAARQAEEHRVAAAEAERQRIERAEQQAAERGRRQAEQAAQAERDRVQREHDAALTAERQAREEAERVAQAERNRAAAERAAEERRIAAERAEAARIAAEEAKRQRNRQHVANIMGEAKAAIMSCGATEEVAKAIVIAIKANTIPHVGITF